MKNQKKLSRFIKPKKHKYIICLYTENDIFTEIKKNIECILV